MLFADLLSLHRVTFLMLFILVAYWAKVLLRKWNISYYMVSLSLSF